MHRITLHWLAVGLLAGCAGCLPVERQLLTGGVRKPAEEPLVLIGLQVREEGTAPPGPGGDGGKVLMQLPADLPGAKAGPIALPPFKDKNDPEREKALQQLYPVLPPLPATEIAPPGPDGKALTLADLEQIALVSNPLVRRAAADVEAARGAALQAGLPPNPNIGYQGDQIQPGNRPTNNAGQQGVFLQQLIKTGGKLQLARAAAGMDHLNAQAAYLQTRIAVLTNVRSQYFAVLVAQENLKLTRALAQLAENSYRGQVAQVKAGIAAAYEPLNLYVQAVQARNHLTQAQQRHRSAWRQLAAALGQPDFAPVALADPVDLAPPPFDFAAARDQVLAGHTEVQIAHNNILRARYHLRLAEVQRRPDLSTQTVLQQDNTNGNFQVSVQVGLSGLPLFDRNQGNILQARALVDRAEEDAQHVRNDLTQRLAEAFERYEASRIQVRAYKDQVLANQVRVFRAMQARYHLEPGKVNYMDLVNNQQMMASNLATYLNLLSTQWQAVVDVANLLQVENLPPGDEKNEK